MFPRSFYEPNCASVNEERIGSILMRKIIFIKIRSAVALPFRIFGVVGPVYTATVNSCDRKVSDDFVSNNQIEIHAGDIKLGRILLKVFIGRQEFRKDLSLTLHQGRR